MGRRGLSGIRVAIAAGAAALAISGSAWASDQGIPGPIFEDPSSTPMGKGLSVGRYLYLGPLPHFRASQLELTVSKMGLTLRVKAWVPESLRKDYARTLLTRWKLIHDAFHANPGMKFVPMKSVAALESGKGLSSDQKTWLKMAEPYMHHVLEPWAGPGNALYPEGKIADSAYTESILTSTLRFFLDDLSVTREQGLALLDQIEKGTLSATDYAALNDRVWSAHLAPLFTASSDRASEGLIGYLTVVFPIAALEEGPFGKPRESVRRLGSEGQTLESRWWSNLWNDDFGGFPFIQITEGGLAFHGPIDLNHDLKLWYLRRGHVSHGCFRLDPSDIMEFRALLPASMDWEQIKPGIRIAILEWPDVTDWRGDGKAEAVDVSYYSVSGVALKRSPDNPANPPELKELLTAAVSRAKDWLEAWSETQQLSFWSEQYDFRHRKSKSGEESWWLGRNRIPASELLPGYGFDLASRTFTGLPIYEIQTAPDGSERLVRDGQYPGPVPVHTFAHRGGRIIQYRELGAHYFRRSTDDVEDSDGKYPMHYFNRR